MGMVPFRVFDRDKKELWVVLNFEAGGGKQEGRYLVAKEDDSNDQDGTLGYIGTSELARFKFVEFLTDDA